MTVEDFSLFNAADVAGWDDTADVPGGTCIGEATYFGRRGGRHAAMQPPTVA